MEAQGLHEEDLEFGRDDLGEGITVALDSEEGEHAHLPREYRLGHPVGHAAEGTDGDDAAVGIGNLGDARPESVTPRPTILIRSRRSSNRS